ncbi:hydrolase [Dyadobacter luteus]|uniref:Hydrolase n=1 Tax=Dyadobacter luteus TaxID=2259619 RepID=A0A3D8YCM7_9BACT|nr:hydrolase [Dyadobacter luteus]
MSPFRGRHFLNTSYSPDTLKNSTFLFLIVLAISFDAKGQKPNENYRYHIHPSSSPIHIDGVADDDAWKNTQVADNFFMVTPMDTSFSRSKTEVRMAYDKQNLYILVINFKPVQGAIIVESLKRDFAFGKNDNFLLFMDTFDDRTNGFSFGANAAGAPWDGQQGDGGTVDLSWDNKWVSEVKNDDEKWVWEAAIPFKSIRYKPGITQWGINFSRQDLTISEKSAWAPVPRQFPSASLAYTGVLVWDTPPPNPGPNISLIPYAATRLTRDYQRDTPNKYKPTIGGDVKIGITPSLNLDLTVNPDFSQVDVDVQQTNLNRFELFFPERRQFFLENADLFANFGYATLRPFFSRRIGLGVPIQFGARMSGKLNKNWRIGVLDVQTSSQDSTPVQNYAVFALQRQLFSRSNVRVLFVNRDAVNFSPERNTGTNRFNRNIGAEFNLASTNNLWTGKVMVLKSFTPEKTTEDYSHAADLKFSNANFTWQWQHEYVGKNYNAEVGYVPNATRMGYYKISPNVAYLFFVKSRRIISHGPKLVSNIYWDNQKSVSDQEYILSYNINFINRATISVWGASNYVRLLRPFDPTNLGGFTLETNSEHNWKSTGFDIASGPQNRLTYNASGVFGGYYQGGHRNNLRAELGYRFQPFVAIAMAGNYNDIRLPAPWNRKELWLVGPRIDVTFTNKLFFTTFVQYNNQADNINLNSRIQWRYKPASDLFLVYTDNYLAENFRVKNRAVVLKFTYWWNL